MTLPSIQQMLSGDQFFDTFFEQLSANKFPLYNVIVDEDNEKIIIEFALAGYKKENLDVRFAGNILTVSGCREPRTSAGRYHVRNVSQKSFSTKYKMPNNYELAEASFVDGMLVIELKAKPEEEEEVHKIEIK